jgi:quinolinate synthase
MHLDLDKDDLQRQVDVDDNRPVEEGDQCLDDHGLSLHELTQGEDSTFRAATKIWQEIPLEYARLDGTELERRISRVKKKLGRSLVILGHHYQRDEIIKFADFRGDSFKLSQLAASRSDADYIVFCGVHFMAESADILSAPHQKVILPNMAAGCSMADMASPDDVEDCWASLTSIFGKGLVPITYMNSAASLKAFCGRNDGIVCTSSNALPVMRWAFERGERLLFFPDQHLGRNTAAKLGLDLDRTLVWDPKEELGGHREVDLLNAQVILWNGYCSVHQRFTVEQIRQARERHPDVNVIVHPECRLEVVRAADFDGSTEFIADKLAKAPSGSKWAVGTEINLVSRMAKEYPDKLIFCLDPVVCPCSTMYRIHPAYLAWVLEGLLEGKVINQIIVDDETATWAKVALERMLSIR